MQRSGHAPPLMSVVRSRRGMMKIKTKADDGKQISWFTFFYSLRIHRLNDVQMERHAKGRFNCPAVY